MSSKLIVLTGTHCRGTDSTRSLKSNVCSAGQQAASTSSSTTQAYFVQSAHVEIERHMCLAAFEAPFSTSPHGQASSLRLPQQRLAAYSKRRPWGNKN
ncbi:hypothetical protein eimer1623h09.tmp0001 [Eimeria tenella]|uniref:Uncharacterized protein n=1 Tax=Eimeria tenella TaxID=5802 RepID=C8TDJ1_EIMTE|nr:hypothetical protein eimer1623h09.tmp0001 [Eimeria tenella]